MLLGQASGSKGWHRPSAGWSAWRLQLSDTAAAADQPAAAAGHATAGLSARVSGFPVLML